MPCRQIVRSHSLAIERCPPLHALVLRYLLDCQASSIGKLLEQEEEQHDMAAAVSIPSSTARWHPLLLRWTEGDWNTYSGT
jgi:hypothetical protein